MTVESRIFCWTVNAFVRVLCTFLLCTGYGHIAPKTHFGKVTTIFYAILGIPLMLLCLSNIGDIMAHSFRFLYWRICCYACTRPPKRGHHHHVAHRRGRSFRGTVRSHGYVVLSVQHCRVASSLSIVTLSCFTDQEVGRGLPGLLR